MNCTRTYQQSLAGSHMPPDDWRFTFMLMTEHVYDGFVILSLWEDHQAHSEKLIVPHGGSQNNRFKDVMHARNARMRLYNQPELLHYCNKCLRMYEEPNGQGKTLKHSCSCLSSCFPVKIVYVVVIDGVTVGRPCCSVHNCKTPLANNRNRFCPRHLALANICTVVDCHAPVVDGKKTCSDPMHSEVKCIHAERGQALFHLKQRLWQTHIGHPSNVVPEEIDPPSISALDDEQDFHIGSSGRVMPSVMGGQTSMKKLHAKLGRNRTHNEQVILTPCGLILARETFYGAEVIPTVVVSSSR